MQGSTPLLALVPLVAVAVGLYAWGVWVSRRQNARIFRLATHGILVGSCLALAGAFLALRELANSSASYPASERAEDAAALADNISHILNVAAWPIGLGNLILIASVIALIVGTVRAPARRSPRDLEP